MEFEFDPSKSKANLRKHGIAFDQAVDLWRDPDLIEIPARTADEARYLGIAKLDERHWSAVITYRDEKIRIVSVRRSREEEIEIYEG